MPKRTFKRSTLVEPAPATADSAISAVQKRTRRPHSQPTTSYLALKSSASQVRTIFVDQLAECKQPRVASYSWDALFVSLMAYGTPRGARNVRPYEIALQRDSLRDAEQEAVLFRAAIDSVLANFAQHHPHAKEVAVTAYIGTDRVTHKNTSVRMYVYEEAEPESAAAAADDGDDDDSDARYQYP
jgi:hypothetical protein